MIMDSIFVEYFKELKDPRNLHELVKDSFELKDKGFNSINIMAACDEIDADHGRIESREIEVADLAI